MRIFGRERQSLRIKKARSTRAMYVSPEVEEIEVQLLTEDGERLDLQFNLKAAHQLILDMMDAYEAVRPGLHRGDTASRWMGMQD